MADDPTHQDSTINVAVLSSLMGRLEKTIEQSFAEVNRRLSDHSHRITLLEENEIRREEREKTEDQVRKALREEREARAAEDSRRVTFAISRWQIILGGLSALGVIAGVVVAVVS